MPPALNAPDTLFVLLSTALVLLMTPALALFYGGLVRAKSILNTMMMSLVAVGVVGLLWALLGYSLAFGTGGTLLGDLSFALMNGIGLELREGGTIPNLLFFAYQGTFAIITAALISGAIVERMRFSAYVLFLGAWTLLVYSPVAHWVWGGGWMGKLGILDFAGGTVVHITAGTAAWVAALMVGPRRDYGRQAFLPHNVPMMLTGAALLWFGWVGFNGGSALAVNGTAVQATVNTILAPFAAMAMWMALEYWRTGRATAVGAGTALVVGLVAITPACGFVSPRAALAIGALTAIPCHLVILYRVRTRLDDSLDVLGAHGTGGAVGALLTGVFTSTAWGGPAGLLEGAPMQLGLQALGVAVAAAWTAVATWAILFVIGKVVPLRVTARDEAAGVDVGEHGEEGYTDGEGAILVLESVTPALAPTATHPIVTTPLARSA
ncbi:MAG: ammonium transporter [Gemmatimonadaceae bacterium]|nr:ammonium transporter [Gemmatimonadaceae bacterium]